MKFTSIIKRTVFLGAALCLIPASALPTANQKCAAAKTQANAAVDKYLNNKAMSFCCLVKALEKAVVGVGCPEYDRLIQLRDPACACKTTLCLIPVLLPYVSFLNQLNRGDELKNAELINQRLSVKNNCK